MFKFFSNKTKISLISLVSLFCLTQPANADSPLTSTDLATAYQDLPIIQKAQKQQKLQGEILEFLLNQETPLDEKAAVINALGWNIDGQNNAYLFLEGLANHQYLQINDLKLQDLSSGDRFVLGYLLAMDDYFDLSPLRTDINQPIDQSLSGITPLQLLSQATFQLTDDFTVHFVQALVEAQTYFDDSWCAVYQEPQSVLRQFPQKKRNLRPEAVDQSMEYLNLYAEYCK